MRWSLSEKHLLWYHTGALHRIFSCNLLFSAAKFYAIMNRSFCEANLHICYLLFGLAVYLERHCSSWGNFWNFFVPVGVYGRGVESERIVANRSYQVFCERVKWGEIGKLFDSAFQAAAHKAAEGRSSNCLQNLIGKSALNKTRRKYYVNEKSNTNIGQRRFRHRATTFLNRTLWLVSIVCVRGPATAPGNICLFLAPSLLCSTTQSYCHKWI